LQEMRWPGSGGRGCHPRWPHSDRATQREQKEQIPVAAEPGYFACGCITIGYHLLVIPNLPLPYAACHPDQVYFKESHSQRAGRVCAIVLDLHGVTLGRPPDQRTNFSGRSTTGLLISKRDTGQAVREHRAPEFERSIDVLVSRIRREIEIDPLDAANLKAR
jgi:hypothetical protein